MEDATTIGALLALAIGLVRIIETALTWGVKRFSAKAENGSNGSDGKQIVCYLDPQASQALVTIMQQQRQVLDIVSKTNWSGTPLIYAPEAIKYAQEASDHIKEVLADQQVINAAVTGFQKDIELVKSNLTELRFSNAKK